MTPSIFVDRLSKRYILGEMHRESMLRDVIANFFKSSRTRSASSRDELWAINDISFNVAQGEVVGIIGRNGAGKSTLLKLLSQITEPTSGEIYVNGRLSSLLEVGTGFHEEMTGKENIFLNGSILGMSRKEIDAKMEAIVDFSGVGRFLDTPIKRYSTGMKLRLGFAVAAHLEPDVLLVDEVLAVGDAEFQKKCLARMDEMHGGGRTVLFVSHNLTAVEQLCPRSIWIDSGSVRMDGPTRDVIHEYMSIFAHSHQGVLDLSDAEGRWGNGKCRITGVEFLDRDGQPKPAVRSGDSLTVRISFIAHERVREPHFGFRLKTDLGRLVTDISTWSTGREIPFLECGKGTIDFEIDFLNLMPDRYLLTLWSQGVGPQHFDIVEDCMTFQVEPSDYYESGRGIDNKFGLVFFPGCWRAPVLMEKRVAHK